MNGRDQTQTPVKAAAYLKDLLNSHTVDDDNEPDERCLFQEVELR